MLAVVIHTATRENDAVVTVEPGQRHIVVLRAWLVSQGKSPALAENFHLRPVAEAGQRQAS